MIKSSLEVFSSLSIKFIVFRNLSALAYIDISVIQNKFPVSLETIFASALRIATSIFAISVKAKIRNF